jgi:hypothetical protein
MSYEKIKGISDQILNRLAAVRGKGEQATKQSLVLPMLDALGYDIWNPTEVCPEYDADFAIRKAGQKEKVDIAIFIGGTARVYIETKPVDDSLDGHEGQLSRYFNSTQSVTLGILTNGIEWRFFTDTGDPNVMDAQPFHITRLDAADQGLDVVARFAKPVFCPEAIRDYATELRYTAQIAGFLRQELDLKERDPSEYFLRWVLKADKMYDGVVNANVLDRFRPIAKDALTRVIREIVRRSINAMEKEAAQSGAAPSGGQQAIVTPPQDISPEEQHDAEEPTTHRGIVTTERELRGFELVKNIFDSSSLAAAKIYDSSTRKEVPVILSYKDTTAYFGINFNKPSWWIMRLYVEGRKNWIGFNVDEAVGAALVPAGMTRLDAQAFSAFRVQVDSPEDIDKLRDLVLAAMKKTIDEHGASKPHGTAEPAPASP